MSELKTISTEQLHHVWGRIFISGSSDRRVFQGRNDPWLTQHTTRHDRGTYLKLNLPKEEAIVVYWGGPTCPQSLQAARQLTDLGYTNVRVAEGSTFTFRFRNAKRSPAVRDSAAAPTAERCMAAKRAGQNCLTLACKRLPNPVHTYNKD